MKIVEFDKFAAEWPSPIPENAARGPAFVVVDGDRPAAVCGFAVQWPGMAEAWLVCIDCGRPVALARALRSVVERTNFRRIQANVRFEAQAARRFVRWLGFSFEGLMESWGPDGADYVRYARVR